MATLVRDMRFHAEAALLRRFNAGAGFADGRLPSQIYLRDEAALARIAGGTLRPQGTHKKAVEQLERMMTETLAGGLTRMMTLTLRLGLEHLTESLIVAALA